MRRHAAEVPNMKSAQRNKALDLRMKYQLGYGTIAKQLSVSKSTLSRWLKDFPLSDERILELRREIWGRGEASRELFRATMRKKRALREKKIYHQQRRKFKTISSQALFTAGLMLYLGEGDKKDRSRIGLANTDPWVVTFFVRWLTEFLNIPRNKMKVELHLYESMDIKAERRFWLKQLSFRPSQLYKDQVRQLRQGSFSYSESYRHGTCKLYAGGVKEKTQLMLSIQAFLDTYNKRALSSVVEHSSDKGKVEGSIPSART